MNEKDYYENEAFWTEERFLKNQDELVRFKAIQSIIPSSVASLLDVGCGNGAFIRHLEENASNISLKGFERSSMAIKMKICKSNIVKGIAEDIIFQENSFDLVTALEVIEHLPYKIYEKALVELQRISKEFIIISVPYKENERLIQCSYCGSRFSPFYHMREFDKKKMIDLFDRFELIHTELVLEKRKYFIWDFFKNIWYLNDHINKINYTCPQCGFTLDTKHSMSTPTASSSKYTNVKTFLKKLTPYKSSYHWIVCLYKKRHNEN
jgi:SAM-dependent methyltransferase